MPPYTVLNARVKQKIATEADWLAVEDLVDPILEGEQAFVWNGEKTPVNFKIGDGTRKFSELPYFITYMSGIANQKVLPYIDQNIDITITGKFRNQSLLQKIILINNSGFDFVFKAGTSNGDNDIFEISVPNGPVAIDVDFLFTEGKTVYLTGLQDVNYSLFILYLQMDEAPVAPSGGTVSTGSSFKFGTLYPFYPMYSGHAEDVWDFLTGKGREDTEYEGCTLMGTNTLDDLSDFYLKGYANGDTIGGTYGRTTPSITILKENLPPIKDRVYGTQGGRPAFGGGEPVLMLTRDAAYNNAGSTFYDLQPLGGNSSPILVQPKSKSVLFFTGPNTTT